MVVPSVIILLFLYRCLLDILKPAYNWVAIGVDFVSGGFFFLKQQTPGRIQTGFQLLDDNLLLSLKFVGIKGTIHHAIRFDVESDIPTIRSEAEVIRRKIVRCEGVVAAAILQRQEVDFTFFETFGS